MGPRTYLEKRRAIVKIVVQNITQPIGVRLTCEEACAQCGMKCDTVPAQAQAMPASADLAKFIQFLCLSQNGSRDTGTSKQALIASANMKFNVPLLSVLSSYSTCRLSTDIAISLHSPTPRALAIPMQR